MYAVEAPDVTPGVGGLLEVANVIKGDPDHGRISDQGVVYEGKLFCGQSLPVPTDGSDKVFGERPQVTGNEFKVYRGLDQSAFISDIEEAKRDLQAAFEAGASFAVERAVQEQELNRLAVDITPEGGTTNAKLALGLLEQYAAEHYSGLPLLHANRLATHLLGLEAMEVEEGILSTKNGTPVANGGGYSSTGPGGVAAAANEVWVYISGQVNIWTPSKVDLVDGYALKENRALILAEATYAASVECFVAAVRLGA